MVRFRGLIEIVLNRRFGVIDAAKYAASDALLGNVPEEALDPVQRCITNT
ncbi:hypothetical protein [Methyloglobulus sp.]